MFNTIDEALIAFKNGNPILVVDDESRENEGDIIFPAVLATQEKLNLCATQAKGLICIAIDVTIAKRLNLAPVSSNHLDPFHTAFYDSIDASSLFGITTGISAKERAITAKHIANPNSKPSDFIKPGHLFPVVAKSNGVLVRQGHTEAAVDLCKLTNHEPAAIICEVMDDEGNMMRRDGLFEFAKSHLLPIITIQQIIDYRNKTENHLLFVSKSVLPTSFGNFDVTIYENYLTGIEHVLISMNATNNKPIVRIHSECLTGDVFGSLRCDCQQQLHNALSLIAENGNGYVIYLRGQEGRGIGIGNKIAAYALQEQGLNTYEANEKLGLPSDNRNYIDAIWLLKILKLNTFLLISNNPQKVNALVNAGFDFTIVQLPITANEQNKKYLNDKIELGKHTIKFNIN
jgi:3,4-dihydroxy 2-butanone 4-phosphate synthase/GTP cyclohydrolase II